MREPESARLFLALWPDAPARAGLARHRDAWRWNAGASVVRTDLLHLTLHFIGDVQRHGLSLLGSDLQVAFNAFELELDTPELWPNGVAALCPQARPAELMRLHSALGRVLQRQGLACGTRKFRPHVTLARRALGAVPPARGPALRWPVMGYALVESTLGAGGGYRVLREYACGC